MPKLIIQDDCFAPYGKMELKVRGPNPFDIYKKTTQLVMDIFELEEKDVWERDFRWDTTGDPRSFFVRIIANKSLDLVSKIRVEIVFQGKQPSDPTKEGTINIGYYGRLVTEFSLNTYFRKLPIYQGFLRLYNFFFYNSVRRNYLKICREQTQRLMVAHRELVHAPGFQEIMEKPIK